MNFSNAKRLLSPPIFDDDEKTRTAQLLHTTLVALFLTIALIGLAAILVIFKEFEFRSGLALLTCLILIGIYVLTRLGYIQFASILLILTLWGAFSVGIAWEGGIRTPGFAIYTIISLLAGLLLGVRSGFIVVGLSIIAGIGMVYGEINGSIVYEATNIPLAAVFVLHTSILVLATTLLYLYTQKINYALASSQHNEQALLESNRMLRDEISERQQIEEALQQSQSRLQLALDAGAIGIWDWDVVNGRIYMDDRLATIFGVDVSQIKAGIPYADFIRAIHHEYQDRVVELIDQTLETGQPYTSEFQIVSGGSFRWVVAHGHVEKGQDGRSVRFFGTLSDITVRKQTENMLRDSEERFRTVFEHAPMAINISTLDGRYLHVNKKSEELLGYSKEELIDHRSVVVTHPEDRAKTESSIQEAQKGDGQWIELEKRYIRKDGEVIWARVIGTMLENGAGEPTHLVGLVEDISERRQIQEALRESEEKLRSILEGVGARVNLLDLAGTVLYANRFSQDINIDDYLGSSGYDGLTPEQGVLLRDSIEIVQRSGKTTSFEDSHLDAIGIRHHFYNVMSPIFGDGEVTGVTIVASDVTELKELEMEVTKQRDELERSNKELQQFAYVAAHDLQEPLRTVTSFTQLLAQRYSDHLDETGQRSLQFITKAAGRMSNLIKDLLDYSLLGSKRKISMVNCQALVEAIQADLDTTIAETKATILVADLPELHGYEIELRLLFQNLISNALKFRQKDIVPQISISASQGAGLWTFAVQDNGIGIEAKHQERIFQIFQRLHTKKMYEGTGIGLAHCQKIVSLHGGKIWVESQPGEGSTFYFAIPA